MADFQINSNSGRQWASGNVKQISGQRGLGFYRLTFVLMLNVETSDSVLGERLTTMAADIFAGGTPTRARQSNTAATANHARELCTGTASQL